MDPPPSSPSSPNRAIKHIEYLRAAVLRPLEELQAQYETDNKDSIASNNRYSNAFHIAEIKEEVIVVNNKTKEKATIHRLFVTSADGGAYCCIGWVLPKELLQCMSCRKDFNENDQKHHCLACGNLVCEACSKNPAYVVEIIHLGLVDVCKDCYEWGVSDLACVYGLLINPFS